jgi:hypothetical protein
MLLHAVGVTFDHSKLNLNPHDNIQWGLPIRNINHTEYQQNPMTHLEGWMTDMELTKILLTVNESPSHNEVLKYTFAEPVFRTNFIFNFI